MCVALTHSKKDRAGETTSSDEQEGLTHACIDVKTACKGSWVTPQDQPTLCWDQTPSPAGKHCYHQLVNIATNHLTTSSTLKKSLMWQADHLIS